MGYRSNPISGAPFDAARAVVPNDRGSVQGPGQGPGQGQGEGQGEGAGGDGYAGLYVTGWLKRGPTGVILTNVTDAAETAAAVLRDRAAGKLGDLGSGSVEGGHGVTHGHGHGNGGERRAGGAGVAALLAAQPQPVVDFAGWLAIDAEERRRGAAKGKVREMSTDQTLAPTLTLTLTPTPTPILTLIITLILVLVLTLTRCATSSLTCTICSASPAASQRSSPASCPAKQPSEQPSEHRLRVLAAHDRQACDLGSWDGGGCWPGGGRRGKGSAALHMGNVSMCSPSDQYKNTFRPSAALCTCARKASFLPTPLSSQLVTPPRSTNAFLGPVWAPADFARCPVPIPQSRLLQSRLRCQTTRRC